MFPKPIEKGSRQWQITYQVMLPIVLIIWLLPLIAVAVFSIKPDADFTNGNYWGMPTSFEFFTNYGKVFFESEMPRYLFNSLLITVPTVIGVLIVSSMTGFALGVYRFRGNMLLFFIFIAGNFVPFQILMVPVRDLMVNTQIPGFLSFIYGDKASFYDTKTGLVMFHIAFQTGFCTLFMRNFIRALPFPLIEAARVEGVAEWRIFWYIVLPLMKPAIAALSVLIFTFIWNDYFWAVVLTQGPDSQPVTAGITSFNAQYRAAYHLMSAGAIVAALPPVAMFFLMQKHFIAGLTLGAVK
jgi:multiple sugar transport system permease protein